MHKLYLLFLFPLLCFGTSATWQIHCEEEALFLNRIADFWEEGEYQIAKNQIQEFLILYPQSSFSDPLCSALGDLLLREKNYSQALDIYAKITDPGIATRIFIHRMQCLYSMQWYAVLADECEAFLQSGKDDLQVVYYLAIALYHQCLNAEEEPDTLLQLASRAEPYFETLFQSSFKEEVGSAFAHLSCILKNFPQAASIYLELAKTENADEMLFQAALIQAEYDKELAIQTFCKIVSPEKAQESAYNCLVLSFDLKKYEEIILGKDKILQKIPPEKIALAHLFFGRSFLAEKKYQEACEEIVQYMGKESPPLRAALIALLDASYQAKNLNSLNLALNAMESFYAGDEEILNGKFSKTFLLPKQEAKSELEALLAIHKNPKILLELIHINTQMEDWDSTRSNALAFLSEFPNNEQSGLAKNYLLAATTELANLSVQGKEQLIIDLSQLKDILGSNLILAKTLISLHRYQEALPLLSSLEEDEPLLLAICYRDGFQDLFNFCLFGEKACLTDDSLHAALYNAYLERSSSDPTLLQKAEEHLFQAFESKKTPIEPESLIWLANRSSPERAIAILESLEPSELIAIPLSKLYLQNNKMEKAIDLLKSQKSQESTLLLGELYAANGQDEKAMEQFGQVTASLRTEIGASACLQMARLQAKQCGENLEPVLIQLKNLVIQKNLLQEPIYLEAALDYIGLQGEQKKLNLLQKMKKDFESTDDLLSKDYQQARSISKDKDKIYQSYMLFLEAEILIAQNPQEKELQANAKDLLLKIIEENVHPALVARANQCLDQ